MRKKSRMKVMRIVILLVLVCSIVIPDTFVKANTTEILEYVEYRAGQEIQPFIEYEYKGQTIQLHLNNISIDPIGEAETKYVDEWDEEEYFEEGYVGQLEEYLWGYEELPPPEIYHLTEEINLGAYCTPVYKEQEQPTQPTDPPEDTGNETMKAKGAKTKKVAKKGKINLFSTEGGTDPDPTPEPEPTPDPEPNPDPNPEPTPEPEEPPKPDPVEPPAPLPPLLVGKNCEPAMEAPADVPVVHEHYTGPMPLIEVEQIDEIWINELGEEVTIASDYIAKYYLEVTEIQIPVPIMKFRGEAVRINPVYTVEYLGVVYEEEEAPPPEAPTLPPPIDPTDPSNPFPFQLPPEWNMYDYYTPTPIKKPDKTAKEAPPLIEKGLSNDILTRFSNIPNNGIIKIEADNFAPEVKVRNDNFLFEFPVDTFYDQFFWGKFAMRANQLDLFIYEIQDRSQLPDDPTDFFTKASQYHFLKKQTIRTANDNDKLKDFHLTDSGFYVLGARVRDSGGRVNYDFRVVKAEIPIKYGWLPLPNNPRNLINEHMIATNWKNGDHNMTVLLDNTKSMKIPSAFSFKHNTVALGSINGTDGLKLYQSDLTEVTLTNPIPDNVKVTEVLEYKEGFLVSTYGAGVHYVNLVDKSVTKLDGVGDNINFIFLEYGSLYVASDTGLHVGELEGTTFTLNKEIDNNEIFEGAFNEVSHIQVVINKIILTPKDTSGSQPTPVVVINKM